MTHIRLFTSILKMNEPTITITQGNLRGTITKNIDGETFYSFRGIPYAKAPLGKLRFKAPLPAVPWQGTLDATKNGNCCYSKDLFSKKFVGSEDCLNLNVYTKKLPLNGHDLHPVMVWIHGGGFTCGSSTSEIYGPEFLLTSNVVVVTINYRLGLLGFFSLEDSTLGVPGNAGFKDMVMALKWVKNNIKQFNGDPGNVTIFGESAGGAAVHFLMLSPMAKGLFHKAIAQSGCALNPWSRGKHFDKEICEILGCSDKSDRKILDYLQDISVEALLEAQSKINYFLDPNKISPFGLVIEKTCEEPSFMNEEPLDIILSKEFMDIPFMIGYTKLEGMVIDTYRPERSANMLTDFENNIPYFLGYKTGSEKSKNLGQKIKQFYYGNDDPIKSKKETFYEMVTDISFLYGIYSTVTKHAMLSSPIYFYRMSIETQLKFLKTLMDEEKSGVAHGDDVAYLFKSIFTPSLSSDSFEYIAIKRFVKLWTNFAYYGNPTPVKDELLLNVIWKKVDKNTIYFLDIGEKLNLHCKSKQKNLDFWNNIYKESPSGSRFCVNNNSEL